MDALRSILPKSTGYSLVDGGQATSHTANNRVNPWLTSRGKTILLFAISLTFLIFYIIIPHPSSQQDSSNAVNYTRSANFHIVMPVTKADENVCRFLVSGGVLGYPTPIFTNWEDEFENADEAHVETVKGFHDYAESLDASHDDDLMLLVESHDTWMQLRPQNLIDRYFEINRRADRRLRSEFGGLTRSHALRQDIVFAGQEGCEPWSKDDAACFAIPTSSLQKDVLSEPKKSKIGRKADQRAQFKQPHLNAALAIGTVKAMRKLLSQAVKEIDTGTNLGSNQNLFSHIYGEQELWREALRRDSLKSSGLKGDTDRKARNGFTSKWSNEQLNGIRAKAAEQEDRSFEFGIGVDYASDISLSTAYAKEDGQWVTFSNSTHSKDSQLTNDIANALPPFWTFSVEDLPRWTSWKDIPLYTHLPTSTTPAVLRLPELSHPPLTSANAQREADEQTTMWTSMFYHKYARILFDAFVYAPVIPMAISGYEEAHKTEWWTLEWAKAGMHPGKGGWTPYGDFCQDYVPDIFRDGKGDWIVPDWN